MKNWSQIIDFESLNYIEVRGSQGFIAGAKFAEDNAQYLPLVADLIEAAKNIPAHVDYCDWTSNCDCKNARVHEALEALRSKE